MSNTLAYGRVPFHGLFVGNLMGSATSCTNFSGTLVGDVGGAQNNTAVLSVGGQNASAVSNAVNLNLAATSANAGSTLAVRDSFSNFAAGLVVANLNGTATSATTAVNFTGNLAGNVTGSQGATVVASVGGQSASNVATSTDTLIAASAVDGTPGTNYVVQRNSAGGFAVATVTANLNGTATAANSAQYFDTSFAGQLTNGQNNASVLTVGTAPNVATASQCATILNAQTATGNNTAGTWVKRDANGNFVATSIACPTLAGNATSATNALAWTGSLSGNVTGTQNSTVVGSVGGTTAANVASATALGVAATSSSTANSIVLRDGAGGFSANVVTGNLAGNAATADSAAATNGLTTATTTVVVNGSAQPNAGQTLVAQSSTLAAWGIPITYALVTATTSVSTSTTTFPSTALLDYGSVTAGTYFLSLLTQFTNNGAVTKTTQVAVYRDATTQVTDSVATVAHPSTSATAYVPCYSQTVVTLAVTTGLTWRWRAPAGGTSTSALSRVGFLLKIA